MGRTVPGTEALVDRVEQVRPRSYFPRAKPRVTPGKISFTCVLWPHFFRVNTFKVKHLS